MSIRQNRRIVFFSIWNTKIDNGLDFQILERERVTSLNISRRSDRRFASGQKVKLFYAARATRGHRFGGVPTTPRGRDLFLLVLFFG